MVFGLTAPAQTLYWPQIWSLSTRTRLGQPCIRPCFKESKAGFLVTVFLGSLCLYKRGCSSVHWFVGLSLIWPICMSATAYTAVWRMQLLVFFGQDNVKWIQSLGGVSSHLYKRLFQLVDPSNRPLFCLSVCLWGMCIKSIFCHFLTEPKAYK